MNAHQTRPDPAKLEALAEFAAGAGHEINNPVATILGRVQLLLRDETDPDRRQALHVIAGQAYRIRDMIGDLMLFARPPQPQPVRCDLAGVVAGVVDRFAERLEQRKIELTPQLDESVFVWADEGQLAVVVSELLRNSVEAVEPGGHVSVAVGYESGGRRSWGVLTVQDDGPGLTEEEREHLFDPFFSGRQAGRGLGFGLPKCWRIVDAHGGHLVAEPAQPTGLRFRVRLPTPERDEEHG